MIKTVEKRNGEKVRFEGDKIRIAISNANRDVTLDKRIGNSDITKIVNEISEMNKKGI